MPKLTLEAARAGWREADNQVEFWKAHRDEYLKEYPDQFVAVVGGEIVATSHDLQDMIVQLKQRGLNPRDVWLQFFDTNAAAMVL